MSIAALKRRLYDEYLGYSVVFGKCELYGCAAFCVFVLFEVAHKYVRVKPFHKSDTMKLRIISLFSST